MDMKLPGISSRWQASAREQPNKLQVTILNVRGLVRPAPDGGSPAGFMARQSELYCTCDIPGKPQSLQKTPVKESETSDAGWNVAWNFTCEMQDYEIGDSISFTVWEKDPDVVDMEHCRGMDGMLGTGSLTSASLASLSTLPCLLKTGVAESDISAVAHHLECELPLQDTTCGIPTLLRVRVSVVRDSAAALMWPAPLSPDAMLTSSKDVQDSKPVGMADDVADAVAQRIDVTLQKQLTSRLQSLEDVLLAALSRSEQQVITAVSQALPLSRSKTRGLSSSASKPSISNSPSVSSRPSPSHHHRTSTTSEGSTLVSSVSFGTASIDSPSASKFRKDQANFDNASVDQENSTTRKNKASSKPLVSPIPSESHDEKGAGWKPRNSQTMLDVDSLQTNRILEAVGLVSGPPGEGKSRRRFSRTDHKKRGMQEQVVKRRGSRLSSGNSMAGAAASAAKAAASEHFNTVIGQPNSESTSSRDQEQEVKGRSLSSSSPLSSREDALQRVDEGSLHSSGGFKGPRLSLPSMDKLRRARVKIGFLSALKTATKNTDPAELTSLDSNRVADRGGYSSEASEEVAEKVSSETQGSHYCGQHLSHLPGKVGNPDSQASSSLTSAGHHFVENLHRGKSDSIKAQLYEGSASSDEGRLDLRVTDGEVHSSTSVVTERETKMGESYSMGVSYSRDRDRQSTESHNMRYLRLEHEEMLMHKSTSMKLQDGQTVPADQWESDFEESWLPTLVMTIFGIINPLDRRVAEGIFWCQWILALGALIVSVKFVVDGVNAPYSGAALSILTAGTLLGLLSVRSHCILDIEVPLERFAITNVFHQNWMLKSKKSCCTLLMVWVVALLFQIFPPVVSRQIRCTDGIAGEEGPLRWTTRFLTRAFPCAVFAHTSAVFMALLYCQFHILTCLDLMLDSFCRRLFEDQRLHVFVSEWNVVQAILRQSARTLEKCFVIVQTSALCALVLSAVGIWQDAPKTCGSEWILLMMEHAPILLLGLAGLLLFYKGAAVTEQCTRVPSLINSIELEDPVDETRQYVVTYIINSDAGFYVRDVRLTGFMALKITYALLAAMVGLIVQFLRM